MPEPLDRILTLRLTATDASLLAELAAANAIRPAAALRQCLRLTVERLRSGCSGQG